MDFDRFGRWTRREFAAMAGGLASLLALVRLDDADARRRRRRRKRRKKRRQNQPCLTLDATCTPGGTVKCCEALRCDQTIVADVPGTFCCQPEGTPCEAAEPCCSGTCDFLVGGGTCAPCRGRSCNAEQPCCGGLECQTGYCDGCRDRAVSCSSPAQCCFSDCTSGACLSAMGGRCARDVDCRVCYLSHDCDGACVDGVCTA